jgi:hypothetical protein
MQMVFAQLHRGRAGAAIKQRTHTILEVSQCFGFFTTIGTFFKVLGYFLMTVWVIQIFQQLLIL